MGCSYSSIEKVEGSPQVRIGIYIQKCLDCVSDSILKDGVCLKRLEAYFRQINMLISTPLPLNLDVLNADNLGRLFLQIRLRSNMRSIKNLDETRIGICSHLQSPDIQMCVWPGDMGLLGKEGWIPRVVKCDNKTTCNLGSTEDVGLSSPGSSTLGFCIESWVKTNGNGQFFLLTSPGSGGINGCCPQFYILNDQLFFGVFGLTSFIIRSNSINFSNWVHVAVVAGSGAIRFLLNGRRINTTPFASRSIHGQVPLRTLYTSNDSNKFFMSVCELRIWACERTDMDVFETMNSSIPPHNTNLYPSLRLSWLPLRTGGMVHPPGALLFDCWNRKPIGTRMNNSSVMVSMPDSRWTTALPTAFIPTYSPEWMSNYKQEFGEWREAAALNQLANMPSTTPPMQMSRLECCAQLAANGMVQAARIWLPRYVTMPTGMVATIGSSDSLGLTGTQGFTIETWVRLRAPAEPGAVDNTIIGFGIGAGYIPNESFHLTFRNLCPYMGFYGNDVSSSQPIALNQWTHIAACYGDGYQAIFVNGAMMASRPAQPLQGSCTLTIGGFTGGSRSRRPLQGDICELRVWNRACSVVEINQRIMTAIPPLDALQYPGLRLCWLPLRKGGPYSHKLWANTQCAFQIKASQFHPPGSKPTAAATGHGKKNATSPVVSTAATPPLPPPDLIAPCPTLLWDVIENRDTGLLPGGSILPTTRLRCVPVFGLGTPGVMPPPWFSNQIAAIDEWSDAYDRLFTPAAWPPLPPSPPASGDVWIPRVVSFPPPSSSSSVVLGRTNQLGLMNLGHGVSFTIELWMKPSDKVAQFENIIGHEDADSNKGTGLLGMRKPHALRIGLWLGKPYISLKGDPVKHSETLVAEKPLVKRQWSHVAFVCTTDNTWRILVNGCVVLEKKEPQTLDPVAETTVHLFGYTGREFSSEVCELRLWSVERTALDIRQHMHYGMLPVLPNGTVLPGLRMSWLPLIQSGSLLFDVTTNSLQAMPVRALFTRRPHVLPPLIHAVLHTMPRPSVVDDMGDAFETFFLPTLIPHVMSCVQSGRAVTIPRELPINQPVNRQRVDGIYSTAPQADAWHGSSTGSTWGNTGGANWLRMANNNRYNKPNRNITYVTYYGNNNNNRQRNYNQHNYNQHDDNRNRENNDTGTGTGTGTEGKGDITRTTIDNNLLPPPGTGTDDGKDNFGDGNDTGNTDTRDMDDGVDTNGDDYNDNGNDNGGGDDDGDGGFGGDDGDGDTGDWGDDGGWGGDGDGGGDGGWDGGRRDAGWGGGGDGGGGDGGGWGGGGDGGGWGGGGDGGYGGGGGGVMGAFAVAVVVGVGGGGGA
eukprot:gene10427-21755_t